MKQAAKNFTHMKMIPPMWTSMILVTCGKNIKILKHEKFSLK